MLFNNCFTYAYVIVISSYITTISDVINMLHYLQGEKGENGSMGPIGLPVSMFIIDFLILFLLSLNLEEYHHSDCI